MNNSTLQPLSGHIRSNVPRGVYAQYIGERSMCEIDEKLFRAVIRKEGSVLTDNFDEAEIVRIVFVPVMLYNLAWTYGEKARKLAAHYRIDLLRPLCRAFDKVRLDYHDVLCQDLKERDIRHIESEARRFVEAHPLDFAQFYYTINNAFLQKMPNYPFDDLRTYAIMGMLLIRQVDEHNKQMDALVKNRTGHVQKCHRMPVMDKLHYILDAFAGEVGKFDYADLQVCNMLKVIENKISKMQFNFL